MVDEEKDNRIVRAWFLVNAQAEDLQNLANSVRDSANASFSYNEKTFIIRADLTEGPFNLIMAVSAENDELLRGIADHVRAFKGVDNVQQARVLTHVPQPPHKAPGYVTEAEANPTKKGPRGENAWG